jgi:anti-repressor protein
MARMNFPQVFNYETSNVRVVAIDGEPWFVLNDVVQILGLTNSRMVKDRLTDDVSSTYPIQDALGRTQDTTIINEDGLYDVILESRKPEAKSFRKWITSEVVPSIRKTGSYGVNQLPQNYVEALEALVESVKVNQVLEEQVQLNAPKVALYDTAMSAKNNMTMMHVAKTLGIGRNKLFDFLREQKVLMKNNIPYETYVSRGYFDVRQYTITHFTTGLENKIQTMVTPKGMAWIHTLLRERQQAN